MSARDVHDLYRVMRKSDLSYIGFNYSANTGDSGTVTLELSEQDAIRLAIALDSNNKAGKLQERVMELEQILEELVAVLSRQQKASLLEIEAGRVLRRDK